MQSILEDAWDQLAVIVANAEMVPDPRRDGMSDCFAVSLDDINKARKILELGGEREDA